MGCAWDARSGASGRHAPHTRLAHRAARTLPLPARPCSVLALGNPTVCRALPYVGQYMTCLGGSALDGSVLCQEPVQLRANCSSSLPGWVPYDPLRAGAGAGLTGLQIGLIVAGVSLLAACTTLVGVLVLRHREQRRWQTLKGLDAELALVRVCVWVGREAAAAPGHMQAGSGRGWAGAAPCHASHPHSRSPVPAARRQGLSGRTGGGHCVAQARGAQRAGGAAAQGVPRGPGGHSVLPRPRRPPGAAGHGRVWAGAGAGRGRGWLLAGRGWEGRLGSFPCRPGLPPPPATLPATWHIRTPARARPRPLQVYKACLYGVHPVAVKVFQTQDDLPADDFWKEISILRTCRHSNIVQFQGTCVDGDTTMMVTELMDTDLYRALQVGAAGACGGAHALVWHLCGPDEGLRARRGSPCPPSLAAPSHAARTRPPTLPAPRCNLARSPTGCRGTGTAWTLPSTWRRRCTSCTAAPSSTLTCEGRPCPAVLRAACCVLPGQPARLAVPSTHPPAVPRPPSCAHPCSKSPNILLSTDNRAKLADVGWAQILYHSYITGDGGTFNWAAPEQLIGLKCTAKADVYSYGLGERPRRGGVRVAAGAFRRPPTGRPAPVLTRPRLPSPAPRSSAPGSAVGAVHARGAGAWPDPRHPHPG